MDRFHGKLRDRIPLELEEDPEETECVWQLEQWEVCWRVPGIGHKSVLELRPIKT